MAAGDIDKGSMPTKSVARWKRGLPWLLALLPALLLRLDWWTSFSATPLFQAPAIDEGLHWDWARRLAAGAGSPEIPYFRAPLHAWWLGLLHRGGLELTGLRLASVATGLAGLGLLLALAWRRIAPGARPWLLGLAGASASWIFFEPMLLIAHWMLFWLLLSLLLTLRGLERGGFGTALGAGLAFGLATISRPTVLILLPVLLWPGASERDATKRGPLPRRWLRRALPWLVAAALPIGLVAHANGWPASGVLIASQGGVNLWIGNHPGADGRSAVLPGAGNAWERSDATAQAQAALGHAPTPAEESAWFARRALDWMRDEPAAAARLLLWKAALLLSPEEAGNNTNPMALAARAPLFGPWLAVGWWVLLLPGLAGLALGFPRHRELRRVCWSGLLLYGLGIVLFFVNSRFRLPLLPLLALPAAELAHAVARRLLWTARRTWRQGSEGTEPPAVGLSAVRLRWLLLLLALPLLAHLWTRPAEAVERNRQADAWQAFQLGNAWWRLQEADSAQADWRRALALAPALPEVRVNLALAAARQGRIAEAESLLHEELVWQPASAKAWTNLGAIALQAGREAQAEAAFRSALRWRPGWSDADWNLGLTLCRRGLDALANGDGSLALSRLSSADSTSYRGETWQRLSREVGAQR